MRVIVWIAVAAILGAIGSQLYRLHINNGAASDQLGKMMAEVQALEKENETLKADISYYSEPENLAKELKAKFDYKKPGEKLIKVQ
jgi:cell division protein FtsB